MTYGNYPMLSYAPSLKVRAGALLELRRREQLRPPYQSEWYASIARPEQKPPPWAWRIWLYLAGRGAGKTRSGAEWVQWVANTHQGARIGLIAPTAADVRDVMVEGESGIMAIAPDDARPTYTPSLRRLTWPNGSQATTYSADEPERLRGPQHTHLWADEMCSWRYPATWDNALLGLRLGANPQVMVTTTPKPIPLLKKLVSDKTVHVTKGSTYDNAANLAPAFMAEIINRYEGTRLGRQELNAEILDDAPGALWNRAQLDALRVVKAPDLSRLVVAIDPAATSRDSSDETGIIAVGRTIDGHYYILDDKTLRASPHGWASAAVSLYHLLGADRIIAETNNGGEMVELTVRTVDKEIPYRAVHASRGKQTRAEPIAALYEQGKVHHVGMFVDLEDQMCEWEPSSGDSPDRIDALVWGITDLMQRPQRRSNSMA